MITKAFAAALLLAASLAATSAQAAGGGLGFALACENGETYPFQVAAVSQIGEVVTGYVSIGRRPIHVRLMPMGDGYRYAGVNLWFDGKDDVAILYFGKAGAVNCKVVRQEIDAVVISAKS
jgi:hypothetical protein